MQSQCKYSLYSLPEPMKLLSKYSYFIWNIEHQTVNQFVERANKAIFLNIFPYKVIISQLNRLIDVRPQYTKKICKIAKKIILLHDGVVYDNLHPIIGYVIKDNVKLPDTLLNFIEKNKEEIEIQIESGFKKGTLDHALLWDNTDEFKTLYFQQAKNLDEFEPEEPIIDRDESGKIIRVGNNKAGFVFNPSEEMANRMVESIKRHNAEILAKRKSNQKGIENTTPKELSPEDLDPKLFTSPEDENTCIKRDQKSKYADQDESDYDDYDEEEDFERRRQQYDDDEEEYDEDSWVPRRLAEISEIDDDVEYDTNDFEEDGEVYNEMDNYGLMEKAARYGSVKIFYFLRKFCFPHKGILQSACNSNKIRIVNHILRSGAGNIHSHGGADIAYHGYRKMIADLEGMIKFTSYNLITNFLVDTYFDFYIKTGKIDNPAEETGETVLMGAAEVGLVSLMDFVVKEGCDINAQSKIRCETALHYAVKGNQPLAVKWLVDHGAMCLNNSEGLTPLEIAIQYDYKEIINILSANFEGTYKIVN